ncbi:MAG: 50S ribosomal protein L6 [Kiritimatiellaeota bacterium]|nr:50S ribosomal protein L6 [Kiritimatiellota bacterium]
MSRIGKKPIKLEAGVKVETDGQAVKVVGPKGSLGWTLPQGIAVRTENDLLIVERRDASRQGAANHGLARSLLEGFVTGVSKGFRKTLEIQGVGYRGQVSGQKLTLALGFSHPVEFEAPEGIAISMPNQTTVVIEGIDKQLVGQTAATIRGFRPPDSYKGKGVRYAGEEITLKEGKTVG